MLKAIRDLRDQKNTLVTEAQAAIDAKDFKKAKEIKDQIAEINDRITTIEALEEEKRRNPVKEPVAEKDRQEAVKKPGDEKIKEIRGSNEYMIDFAKAMARRVTVDDVLRSEEFGALKAVLTETGGNPVGSDGGFLVPLDFDKMVWEIKKTLVPLSNYVTVENVNVPSGWRAVEKQAASQGFTKFAENDTIPDSEEPGFVKVTFQLEDYGGLLPISNDLLSDTPINLLNYISRWYARKTVLTENSLILSALKAITPIAYDKTKGISALKTVLNKTLITAHAAASVIITNQSGFDYLDQLLDLDDRPLLQPDPTNATAYKALAKPVVVIDDDQCANITDSGKTYAPIFVGDYREFIDFFRKGTTEMASTNIGGTAWTKNQTQVRAIMRLDLVTIDSRAAKLLRVEL